jgi:hypothetical protein
MCKEKDIADTQQLADALIAAGSPYAYIILDCIDVMKGGDVDEVPGFSATTEDDG